MSVNYVEAAANAEKKLLEICKDAEGWTEVKKENGIIVYSKKSNEFAGNMYKSEFVVDGSNDIALQTWLPSPKGVRLDWDNQLEICDILKELSDDTVIMRSISKSFAMGMISSREFCDVVKISYYPDTDTRGTAGYSVEYPDCPVQSKHVRGKNYPCGIFFRTKPNEKNKCDVTYIIHSDIGGMLPRSLVESAVPGNTLKTLQTFKTAVANKSS